MAGLYDSAGSVNLLEGTLLDFGDFLFRGVLDLTFKEDITIVRQLWTSNRRVDIGLFLENSCAENIEDEPGHLSNSSPVQNFSGDC